jgi:cytochrome b
MSATTCMNTRVLVWDAPTRVFHWLLAASFAGAYLTSESERLRDIHLLFGYTLIGLIGFRLLWGLIGTRYARFRSFAFGPREVVAYLRSLLSPAPSHYIGHNPAGSWAIYLVLVLGLVCGITGYLGQMDIGGDPMKELHEGVAGGMLAVVVIHVGGAILSSLRHRENLILGMISGYKRGRAAQGIRRAWPSVAIALVALVIALWSGAIPAPGLSSSSTVPQGHGLAGKHADRD